MRDWNVVFTVRDGKFKEGIDLLRRIGAVDKTPFFNVLCMKLDDPTRLPELLESSPERRDVLGHATPCIATFNFQSPEEFEERARDALLPFVPQLAGKRLYVRIRRRGFKGRLSTQAEERFLDDTILAALRGIGATCEIGFEDPDAVIVVETLNNRGGLAIWQRDELRRYPFLRPD